MRHATSGALDHSDDLMPQDERKLRILELAESHVEIGPTNGTRPHSDQHLPLVRHRNGRLPEH
jgi:hypothetical protein